MIEWIIRRSVANRFLVMMAALFLRNALQVLTVELQVFRHHAARIDI